MIYNSLSLSINMNVNLNIIIYQKQPYDHSICIFTYIYRQANMFYNLSLCCYLPSLDSKHKHAVEYPKNYLTLMKHDETPA